MRLSDGVGFWKNFVHSKESLFMLKILHMNPLTANICIRVLDVFAGAVAPCKNRLIFPKKERFCYKK